MSKGNGNWLGYYIGGEVLYIIGAVVVAFLSLCFAIYVFGWLILIFAAVFGIVWLVKKIRAKSAASQVAHPQDRPPTQAATQVLEEAAAEQARQKTNAVVSLCAALDAVADRKTEVENARRADRTS